MYTTCIFCHEPLGANETIEHFPIGRRLAFDSAKGRLWVVCHACAQWNLTPLEERWEAVEECERAYRSVRTRVSTPEIGLARLAEGLDLVAGSRRRLSGQASEVLTPVALWFRHEPRTRWPQT